MALAGLFKRWKHSGGRRDLTVEIHAEFMDLPFIRSDENVAYERPISTLMTQLPKDAVVLQGVSLDL